MDNHKPLPEAAIGPLPASVEVPQLPPQLEEARVALSELNDRALAFARAKPLTCIAGALALGFIVGKIAARY